MSAAVPEIGDIWYRYDDISYAPIADDLGNSFGTGRISIVPTEYRVIKITPKGVRLVYSHQSGNEWSRMVLFGSRKQFACPTKSEAAESFIRRKQCQVSILTVQLRKAQECLVLARGLK